MRPIMKKVAFTPRWARAARMAGVYAGSGPSSKVIATTLSVVAIEVPLVGRRRDERRGIRCGRYW